MLIHSEQEMLDYGQKFGAGKTTFTRGLAKGLGVKAELSSPSFTISREYRGEKYNLVHYDFYRLEDPGLMMEDLAETINDPTTITIIEWGQSIKDILPDGHIVIEIKYIDENTRELTQK